MADDPSTRSETVRIIKSFEWSSKRAEAAVRVAEDTLSNQQISDLLDINPKTLTTWKKHPEFAARVDEHVVALQDRARKRALARLDKRQDAQFDRHRRMTELIEIRAKAYPDDHPFGGTTGMVVSQLKSVTVRFEADPNDPDSKASMTRDEVYEYQFDAALARELAALEKQIAQDAGQWSEKREITGAEGVPLVIQFNQRSDGPQ